MHLRITALLVCLLVAPNVAATPISGSVEISYGPNSVTVNASPWLDCDIDVRSGGFSETIDVVCYSDFLDAECLPLTTTLWATGFAGIDASCGRYQVGCDVFLVGPCTDASMQAYIQGGFLPFRCSVYHAADTAGTATCRMA